MSKQFFLPELGYAFNALEPVIDARTMELHHDKHHASYVSNLNKALENAPEFFERDINDICGILHKSLKIFVQQSGTREAVMQTILSFGNY